MVVPGVIGGFVALDGAILGQIAYAITHYRPEADEQERDAGRTGRR
ncbi:MAG TPA: hypothetical protein VFN82_08725 [Solirubrobacterales bacterium]|jgi:hypothetical protein|nr:hypothetical protein [Solirubrobacterales bacterium]